MCGIFVAFSKKGTELSEKRCISASKEIYNRGPDFFKYSFLRNKTLYMSNTILSITGKPTTNKEQKEHNEKKEKRRRHITHVHENKRYQNN